MAGITLLNPGKCLGYGGYGGYGGDCYDCDGWCSTRCLDYNRLWQIDVIDVFIYGVFTYANATKGPVSAGLCRWGWVSIDLDPVLNTTHYHTLTKASILGSFPKPSAPAVPCNSASGNVEYEVNGTLYLSGLTSSASISPPAEGTFVAFPFTVTLRVGLTIYDNCGLRTSACYIDISSLEYDDTDVFMEVYGNGVVLSGEYPEIESCNVLPLAEDDIWFNSSSFFGYNLTGYRKDDTTNAFRSLWKGGSALFSSQVTQASSGTSYIATPL